MTIYEELATVLHDLEIIRQKYKIAAYNFEQSFVKEEVEL